MKNNINLNNAKKNKNDEFYTRYEDIAKELPYYKEQLANKIIYCNCDNPQFSNFYKYLKDNFHEYKLQKLIATHLGFNEYYSLNPTKTVFDGENEIIEMLGGCGDFRSPICVNILQQTDIVITNPPFSLFREFVDLLVEYDKKFLILGNINAITCKNIFPLIRDNKIWLGQSIKGNNIKFEVPDNNSITDKQSHKIYANVNGVRWFTNLENNKPLKKLNLTKHYNKDEYPKYVNFDAINVDKVADIPYDYDGIMGVPISFIDKYNPEQFEIIGISADFAKSIYINGRIKENPGRFYLNINGEYKRLYDRILIKRRNNNK